MNYRSLVEIQQDIATITALRDRFLSGELEKTVEISDGVLHRKFEFNVVSYEDLVNRLNELNSELLAATSGSIVNGVAFKTPSTFRHKVIP